MHRFKFIHNYLLFIIYYRRVLKLLKNKNIEQIKIFNFKNWHHGYAYLSGFKDNKKVFIKIDTKLLLLQNDLLVYNIANEELKKYLVKIIDSIILSDIQIIIYEFLNGHELSKSIIEQNPKIIITLINSLEAIDNLEIIHRDIKLDNFFITKDNIKLIDFTFANSLNKKLGFKELNILDSSNCSILEVLGNGLNPNPFEWNDFYTLKKIINSLESKQNLKLLKYLEILNKKHSTTYNIRCNNKYLKQRNLIIKVKNFLGISHKYRDLQNIKKDNNEINKSK